METPDIDKHNEKTQPTIGKKILALPVLIFVVTLVALVIIGYLFIQNQKTQGLQNNPSKQSVAEADAVIAQVGKLIELPANENPQVASVTDKRKLADQPFFRNAQNGDKVLVYSQSKKLILYRPSINKIIEVSAVNLGQTNPQPTVTPSPTNTTIEATPTVNQNQNNPQPSTTP